MRNIEKTTGIHFCNSFQKFYTRYTSQKKTTFVGRFKTLAIARYMQKRFGKTIFKLHQDEMLREALIKDYTPCVHFCKTSGMYMARLLTPQGNLYGGRFKDKALAKAEIRVMKQAVKQYAYHFEG